MKSVVLENKIVTYNLQQRTHTPHMKTVVKVLFKFLATVF